MTILSLQENIINDRRSMFLQQIKALITGRITKSNYMHLIGGYSTIHKDVVILFKDPVSGVGMPPQVICIFNYITPSKMYADFCEVEGLEQNAFIKWVDSNLREFVELEVK